MRGGEPAGSGRHEPLDGPPPLVLLGRTMTAPTATTRKTKTARPALRPAG